MSKLKIQFPHFLDDTASYYRYNLNGDVVLVNDLDVYTCKYPLIMLKL